MLAAGLIAGIVSSVLFNLGIALQAIEARRTPREEGLRASLIWDLLHRRLWVTGLGIEWLGVPLEILAFAWAPFVVVQPLLACGLLVLLAVARRLLGEMPSRGALAGVALIIAGIGLIAWGAPGEQDTHRGAAAVIGVMAGLVLASLVPFALRGRRGDTAMTAVLGSACGFAATNVAMKLMADDIGSGHLVQAVAWLAVAGVVGFGATVSGMTALQRAAATTVIPISTAVQTFLPVALEPLFLEESFRDASLEGIPLLVGLVVMLVGIVALARTRHVSAIVAGVPGEGRGGPGSRGRPGAGGAVPSAP
ncbi:MAG TPA: DMT family transporter [Solirubrobacterales bacterium]|nr:DMT family transporter [Solirubrobacterales bacterium]